MTSDSRKQSFYIPEKILRELCDEAERLDRSLSWMIQTAWKLAKEQIRQLPTQRIP